MATLLKKLKRETMSVIIPRIIYELIDSPEFRYEFYKAYLGKEPTCQGHVDQVFNSIKHELYLLIHMLWRKQETEKYGYLNLSHEFFLHLFKRKYKVVKEILEDLIGMEYQRSPTSGRSYKVGEFPQGYRSNIDLSTLRITAWSQKNIDGTNPFKRIKFPYHVSKRLKTFFHRHENQEFIDLVDECQLMIELDDNAPEYIKEEFDRLPTMLTKKRTDNRFYGMGSGSSKESRKWMRFNGEKGVEIDIPSAYVHFSISNCYEQDNFDHFEEKMRLTLSMKQQNIYDQIVDFYDMERDDVKVLFNSIMNNKITDPTDLDIYQRAVWEFINDQYPIYAEYMLKLNTREYGETLENKLQRKLYNDSRRIAYLFNSQEESGFMMEFIQRFTDTYGKMPFLWVHDAIYVPESYAERAEEMMYDLFEELYKYKIN